MPKITFIQFDGTENTLDVEVGSTLMNNAVDNLISGIDADCGGECSCATCHVLVEDSWLEKVGKPSDAEESMLDLNPDRTGNSRLSCQIVVTEELDGLVVNLPEFQY
ncbi:MAG: 2Fe-2S iron-sulfur cluster-binding protein [Pseudomonadales bacterium]